MITAPWYCFRRGVLATHRAFRRDQASDLGAAVDLGLQLDPAAVQFDQAAHQGEPQAGAAAPAAVAAALESAEDQMAWGEKFSPDSSSRDFGSASKRRGRKRDANSPGWA